MVKLFSNVPSFVDHEPDERLTELVSFLVIIFMTPPTAFAPYNEDEDPFIISTLSIVLIAIFWIGAKPSVPGLSSTPLSKNFV